MSEPSDAAPFNSPTFMIRVRLGLTWRINSSNVRSLLLNRVVAKCAYALGASNNVLACSTSLVASAIVCKKDVISFKISVSVLDFNVV